MKQLLNNWLKYSHMFKNRLNFNYFVNQIFKQNCVLCIANLTQTNREIHKIDTRDKNNALQANTHEVCRACLENLPWHSDTSCPQCGLESSGITCGSCINSPPDFDATYAVFLYQFPVDAMMVRYKYGNMLNIGNTFGRFLAEKVDFTVVDLIIPMPMHPQRLKERGYNQAFEIAKVLTKSHKEKLDFKCVQRQTLTPPQASLPLKERVKNIKGAFKVNTDKIEVVTGKRIAIVDDVMTTGASLNELANTLKKAGAAHVECWVIARTLPHK